MDSKVEKNLKSIPDAQDTEMARKLRMAERRKTERELFLDALANISSDVIRPVIENIGVQLKVRGQDDADSACRENQGPDVSSVFPADEASESPNRCESPKGVCHTTQHGNSALAGESALISGHAGYASAIDRRRLDGISSELVEQYVLKVLGESEK